MSQKNTHTIIAVSWQDLCAGNDPEPLGLAFHHQGSTFINAYCQAAVNLLKHICQVAKNLVDRD